MRLVEKIFEGMLWRSRYVVSFAVVASMAAAIAIFYMATVDVFYLAGAVALIGLALYLTHASDGGHAAMASEALVEKDH